MKKSRLPAVLFITAAAVAAAVAHASGGSRKLGPFPLPEQTVLCPKPAGKLSAMLVVTAHWDDFLTAWQHPVPGAPLAVKVAASAGRGDKLAAFVLFSGCHADAYGQCDLSADYRITRPDGGVYADVPDSKVWHQISPPAGNVQMGSTHLTIGFDAEDPVGPYVIKVTVHDRISGDDVTVERTLEVGE